VIPNQRLLHLVEDNDEEPGDELESEDSGENAMDELTDEVPVAAAAAEVKTRAFKLAQTVIVDRPPATVFAFRSSLTNSPEWRRGVVSACLNPPGPVWIGSHCTEVRSGPDETTEEWELEVTDYQPSNVLEIAVHHGDAQVQERHSFAQEGEATRYTVTVDVTGGALSGPAYQKALLESLLQLKWALEGARTLGWGAPKKSRLDR